MYFYTERWITVGQRQDIPARTDPETGDRGTHRQPGGAAAPPFHTAAAGNPGDALAGPAGAETGENTGRLPPGQRARGRTGSRSAAGAGLGRVFAGYPPGGEPAGAEDSSERRATAGCGR